MQKNLSMIIGSHNFQAFTKSKDDQDLSTKDFNYHRTIYDVKIFCHSNNLPSINDPLINQTQKIDITDHLNGTLIELWFYGQGFLRHMLRIIIGSCVYIANNPQSRSIEQILQTKDRTLAYQTAPANPLTLMYCLFDQFNKQPTFAKNQQIIHLRNALINNLII